MISKLKKHCLLFLIILSPLLASCSLNIGPDTSYKTPAATAPAIYILIERSDVYSVGFSTQNNSLHVQAADGSALSSGRTMLFVDDISQQAESCGGSVIYTIYVYGSGNEILSSQSFIYTTGDGVVTITVSADGSLYGGVPAPAAAELQLHAVMINVSAGEDALSPELPILCEVGAAYPCTILIDCNVTLTGITLWELEPRFTDDGGLTLSEASRIASSDATCSSFAVSIDIGEYVPVRGISLTLYNTVRHFYITQSGEDGSAIITEYTPIV